MELRTVIVFCLMPIWALASTEISTISNNVTSTYAGVWTTQSPMYLRQTDRLDRRFYYKTFEINVPNTGAYTFKGESTVKALGYLYRGSFNPIDPTVNIIAQDGNTENAHYFKISSTLEANQTYILVATTVEPEAIGEFSIIVTPPQSPINIDTVMAKGFYSFYIAGSLSNSNPKFYRSNLTNGRSYYYQAYSIIVYTSGEYSFTTNGTLDTYGYLYARSFDPTKPNTNLINSDDDSAGGTQFLIRNNLQFGTAYVLVVTTWAQDTQGNYGLRVTGSNNLDLIPYVPYPSGTGTMPTATVFATTSTTRSTGTLYSYSPTFYRNPKTDGLYYYQAYQVTIYTPGTYSFTSSSSFDTYGYLYSFPMDPSYPASNILADDDDSGGNSQFRITYNFIRSGTFVLIVTTYAPGISGSFTILTGGANYVSLSSYTPVTSRPITSTAMYTTYSPTSYSGSLYSSDPVFVRPPQTINYYYYEAWQISISTSGTYTFLSTGSMDTYGLLYTSPVDPSYPTQNLITSDDDSGGNSQFKITRYLQSSQTYVLIVTTYSSNTQGSYGLRVAGPQSVYMYKFTPSTSRPIRTTTYYSYSSGVTLSTVGIVGVVLGSLFVVALLVSVCAYANKQKAVNSPRVNTVYRTAVRYPAQPAGTAQPFTIPMQTAYVHNVEEPPPTYDQAAAYMKSSKP